MPSPRLFHHYPSNNPIQVVQNEVTELRALISGSPPATQAAAVQQAVNTQAVAEARATAAEAQTEALEEACLATCYLLCCVPPQLSPLFQTAGSSTGTCRECEASRTAVTL